MRLISGTLAADTLSNLAVYAHDLHPMLHECDRSQAQLSHQY